MENLNKEIKHYEKEYSKIEETLTFLKNIREEKEEISILESKEKNLKAENRSLKNTAAILRDKQYEIDKQINILREKRDDLTKKAWSNLIDFS